MNHQSDSSFAEGLDRLTPTNLHRKDGLADGVRVEERSRASESNPSSNTTPGNTTPSTVAEEETKNDCFQVEIKMDDEKEAECRFATAAEYHCTELETTESNPLFDAVLSATNCAEPIPLFSQCRRAFAFLILSLFVMCIALAFVTWRMPDPAKNPQLPDLGYELVGDAILSLEPLTMVCIWMGNISLILSFFVIAPYWQIQAVTALYREANLSTDAFTQGSKLSRLSAWWDAMFHRKYIISDALYAKIPHAQFLREWRNLTFRAIVRYSQVYAFSTILRSVSMLLTSLPTPDNDCVHSVVIEKTVSAVLKNAAIGVLSLGGANKHCGDLLYSGHSIVITVNFVSLWIYGPRFHRLIRLVAVVSLVMSWFSILKSRSHYSDDILFAFYCTTTMYVLTPEYLCKPLQYILFPLSFKRPLRKE